MSSSDERFKPWRQARARGSTGFGVHITEAAGDGVVVRVAGEVDMATAEMVKHALWPQVAPPARPVGVPAWNEAAEDWLAAKRVGRAKDDVGHSDRARRGDLRRWAAAINAVEGREVPAFPPHSLDGWQFFMTELVDVDVLLRALDLLGGELAASSRQRALSTLRGFCGWLVRRQLLSANPCDAPELGVKRPSSGEVLSFRLTRWNDSSPRRPLPHRRTSDRRGQRATSLLSRRWRIVVFG